MNVQPTNQQFRKIRGFQGKNAMVDDYSNKFQLKSGSALVNVTNSCAVVTCSAVIAFTALSSESCSKFSLLEATLYQD